MKKTLLTGIAALFLTTWMAHAQNSALSTDADTLARQQAEGERQKTWRRGNWERLADGTLRLHGHLPPTEYNHFYPGPIEIRRFATTEDLKVACKAGINDDLAGCSFVARGVCVIFLGPNGYYTTIPIESVLRHEMGHCNGWGRDHAGGQPEDFFRFRIAKP
jgi:hypothetical protein